MLTKNKFKPGDFYSTLKKKLIEIKDEKTVTPYDVVIASMCDIRAITDYHECKGVYKK